MLLIIMIIIIVQRIQHEWTNNTLRRK